MENKNEEGIITVKQYLDTINNYNKLVKKINTIEEQNSYITKARKVRYTLCEVFMDIIAIDVLTQFLFGRSVFRIINDIYSYILSLF